MNLAISPQLRLHAHPYSSPCQNSTYNNLVRIKLSTIGGSFIHHELESLDLFCIYSKAYQIFHNTGWVTFFEKLQGFDNVVTLEFSQNLDGARPSVQGLHVDVIEGTILVATRLP
jgi:hypothetical protein